MKYIPLPFNYSPRDYQMPFWAAMERGCKRAVLVWHRRTGKDKSCLNFLIREMSKRVGNYFYTFPEFAQGRAVLWDGIDRDGFKFLDHFPPEFIKSKNETEMKIECVNCSTFQIIGTDRFDKKIGANPMGIVFSEYSLQDPDVWGFFRPILAENNGWAIFNYKK